MDLDFPGQIRIFWPIRIRTQGKQSDPDPGRIRTKGPGSETLPTNLEKSFVQNLIYFFLFLSKIDIIMLCKKTIVGHNGSYRLTVRYFLKDLMDLKINGCILRKFNNQRFQRFKKI